MINHPVYVTAFRHQVFNKLINGAPAVIIPVGRSQHNNFKMPKDNPLHSLHSDGTMASNNTPDHVYRVFSVDDDPDEIEHDVRYLEGLHDGLKYALHSSKSKTVSGPGPDASSSQNKPELKLKNKSKSRAKTQETRTRKSFFQAEFPFTWYASRRFQYRL